MKLKKIKNTLLVVLTLALVSAASVALTYALVKDSLGSAENTFTNEDISVQISEVKWDGEKGLNDTDDDVPTDGLKGVQIASSYSAGQVIPKNPKLSNNSDMTKDEDTGPAEWVAIKVTYTASTQVDGTDTTYKYDTYAKFLSATGAQVMVGTDTEGFNTADWEAKDASNTVFYYKKEALKNTNSTSTLFDNVNIVALATRDVAGVTKYVMYDNNGNEVLADKLPNFNIKLEGYAVQAEGVEYDVAKGALNDLMK